jgi:ubiquinol-cytochrome c reductase cytochrome c1 subunit
MKKLIFAIMVLIMPAAGFAAGGGVPLDKANVDIGDTDSLRRGARYFVNYCLSCHSAAYMRFSRMGKDLDLTDAQLQQNLMFAADKVGETMDVAMTKGDASKWFGTPAPDLSVVARSRGANWLYTYLRGFYIDESRPVGVNNIVFPDVAMPHVLWDLQGLQKANFKTEKDKDGNEHTVFDSFELVSQGSMTEKEYNGAVRDLVAYLVYMGEPGQLKRKQLGIYVLLFLAVFFVVAYRLKKEYWKDIH